MLRGAAALNAVFDNARLRSPLADVTDAAWAKFVDTLTIDDDNGPNRGRPRRFNTRTHAGGLGCFGILPRRLVDLGLAKSVRTIGSKLIPIGFDSRSFANPLAQRDALNESLRRYAAELSKIELPSEISRSGALALYHRLGPQALGKWKKHQSQSTTALFRRANGIF